MQHIITRPTLITAALLLIPFIGMQISNEVNWDGFDFAIVGVMLFVTGVGIELVLKKVANIQHRAYIILAILAVFALTYIELAVGIFNTPFAGS